MGYKGFKDGIYYMILAKNYYKVIKQVIDRYEIDIEVIDSEEEALSVAEIGENKYYKLRTDEQGFLSLNPVYASDLRSVFRDMEMQGI